MTGVPGTVYKTVVNSYTVPGTPLILQNADRVYFQLLIIAYKYERRLIMCFSIKIVHYLSALGVFLTAGVVFADQGTSHLKSPTEQCSKGGKTLPNVKTKDECVKQNGIWVKIGGSKMLVSPLDKNMTMRPPDPLEKNKAMLPDDPLDKNKTKMPVDPLEKNKIMPPAGQMMPSGGQ
jgi:hypothetical protein